MRLLSKCTLIVSLLLLAGITGSKAQQQNVLFFGERDAGCSYKTITGELVADCEGLAVSILDLGAKLSYSCMIPQSQAIWDSTSSPFRLKKGLNVYANAFCYKFASNNLPDNAFGSSGVSLASAGGSTTARPAIWLYDKVSHQVSVCMGNGTTSGGGNFGPVEPACQKIDIKD